MRCGCREGSPTGNETARKIFSLSPVVPTPVEEEVVRHGPAGVSAPGYNYSVFSSFIATEFMQ